MKKFLVLMLVLAAQGAWAEEKSIAKKAGAGVEKGVGAAERGLKRGGEAAAKGIKKAGEWVGKKMQKGGDKLEKASK